jgi:hypothetical protein
MLKLQVVKAAPAGIYFAFGLALYVWHVAASLLGVVIADRLGVSDASPDLKGDLKKMGVCSLIALALFLSVFYIAQSPYVFLVYILSLLFSLKIAYLGSNHSFLLIVLGADLAGMIAFVPIVASLKLPGIFFLYLVSFIAFLVRSQFKKRNVMETREMEKRRERAIRNQVRLDPDFTTFCYQCLFNRSAGGRCQLQIDGEEVHDILINQRRYCVSFQPDPANGPMARE